MKQWDSVGKKWVEPGAVRWDVEWYVFRSQEDADDAAKAECVEDHHFECVYRRFPSPGLARAFAKKLDEPLMLWAPRIQKQCFDPDENGPGVGWWNSASDWEEAD